MFLVGCATALLGVAAVATSYLAVSASLLNDLRASLRMDAQRVADLYGAGQPGTAGELTGPTGGVVVSLFDLSGRLLAASSPEAPLIPENVVREAAGGPRDWQQRRPDGTSDLVALAPFGVGIAAVSSDTAYIDGALTQIARVLAGVGILLVLVSGFVGWVVAGSALAPLRNLSRQAARLGPDRLDPIEYRGPAGELELLSNVLNHLLARLRNAMDSQRQFLLETSHELRTPLTSLQGFLDRAVRRGGDAQPELTDARRIASNMARLVEDLLQLTRGQSVRELVPHLVDPLSDVLEPVAAEYPGVRVDGEPGAMLLGDPGRLRQLVRNLAANAVRAAGPENVELVLRTNGGSAELLVRDGGNGIPPEVQERIFEKFYRGAGGGAGLGLAIARQIAEQHEGSIRLVSRPGFTEFTVALPLVDTGENES